MRNNRRLVACALAFLLAPTVALPKKKKPGEGPPPTEVIEPKKKKSDEAPTQVLPPEKEPPAAITADADHLTFTVTPLSGKGLLSQQTRDALRAMNAALKGATPVYLRAFVAGSGDLRRVQTLVSENFSDKKLPMPALTIVQVGAFPAEAAQVVIEATALDKRVHSPNGLAFISAENGPAADAATRLNRVVQANRLDAKQVYRITCFAGNVDNGGRMRENLSAAFPEASVDVVQLQRIPTGDSAACEAVGAAASAVSGPIQFMAPEAGRSSQVALVGPGKIAFTTSQLAFKNNDEDVRIAFSRTDKALESVGTSLKRTAVTHMYPVLRSIGDRANKVGFEFYDSARPPATTSLIFEGLPAQDALFGIDVVAVP